MHPKSRITTISALLASLKWARAMNTQKFVGPSENVLPIAWHGKFLKHVSCDCCVMSPVFFYPFYSSKMGFGPKVAADRLRIAHSRDLYMPERIYTEGLANQGKLFDSDDTMSPSYSCSQRSPISSFQSSVRKIDNKSPRKLNCCFVQDVTVCDGAQLAPGTHFTKIWRLHNTGTRPWPQHTLLVRIGGLILELEVRSNWRFRRRVVPWMRILMQSSMILLQYKPDIMSHTGV